MKNRVNRHFLTQCSFFPMVAATLVSFGMLAAARFTVAYWHRFLIWNLFLAWLPYAFSLWAVWLRDHQRERPWKLLLPAFLWLLFLPNAPYLVTDFVHLQFDPYPVWHDVAILATFAWTGLLAAMISLRLMESLTRELFGPAAAWGVVLVTTALCGFGIYLGRILRWNSWDVFIHPRSVITRLADGLADPLRHGRAFGTTAIFAAFLLLSYLSFVTARPRWRSRPGD